MAPRGQYHHAVDEFQQPNPQGHSPISSSNDNPASEFFQQRLPIQSDEVSLGLALEELRGLLDTRIGLTRVVLTQNMPEKANLGHGTAIICILWHPK